MMMTRKSYGDAARWTCLVVLFLAAGSGCKGIRWLSESTAGHSATDADAIAAQQADEYLTQPVSYTAPTQAELTNGGPFSKTSTGLSYRVLRAGEGRKPRKTDRVKVHYHGWLDNGSVFDSSYDRGSPTSFRLDQVVPGWTEGLQYVAEGGKIELEIPSHLGYGPGGGGGGKIPPNATLHFVVELLAINP